MMKKLICTMLAVLMLLSLLACEKEPTENEGASFSAFSVGGVTVSLDAEAEPILSALGAPIASAETNSCFGDGKDKIYEYTSFKVQTYSSGGKDYILSVEIYNDADANIATPEGVRVGSSADDVIAKLGEPSSRGEGQMVYLNAAAKTKLQILTRDGAVTNIQYLRTE